jgi:predicted nucleic acid-binding protein
MKYIVDTSFFIALIMPNDINHEKAKQILLEKQILHNDVIFNNFIIEEVFTVLTYK